MKRKNKTNRMAAFLAAVILIVFGLCQAAFAADTNTGNTANIDLEKPVSLNIKLVKEDGSIDTDKLATIMIYQVGKWDTSQGKYVLTEAYASSGAKLEGEDGKAILKEIAVLQDFIGKNNLPALTEGRTQNGQYTSPDLSMGLYMVCSPVDEQAVKNGDNTVIVPFLTTLPIWIEQENAPGYWQYGVEAFPKHGTPQNVNPDPGTTTPGSSGGNGSNGGGGGGRRTTIDPEGTPTTTIDDGGTPLDGLTPPSELIEDDGVPLSDGPFQQLIKEVLVPLGLLPKTGDGSISYAPLLALMGASGLLIIGLIWRRIRKEHLLVK